ncbi:MAG: DUF2279 domain-containing protein [Ignavibacteriae bacterium]|nr:DUF2279 domain-containing protein [Ignavibacteriota bacterium]
MVRMISLLICCSCLFPLRTNAQLDSADYSKGSLTLGGGGNERPAQEWHTTDTGGVSTSRLLVVSGGILAGMTTVHIYQTNGWWKDNRRSFHFQEDLEYGLSVDKLGHFYGASVLTFLMGKAFRWANFSEPDALLMGASASVLFQTFLEVEDGFSTWGFDRLDFAANIAGAAWPVARHHVPVLKNFDFKFSYRPSTLLNSSGGSGFRGQKHIIFDDYEGQTIWLGLKVKNLLPDPLDGYWPGFLGIAVGYGVRNVLGANPHSVIFLGLDLDMTRVIPDSTPFLQFLGEALNYVRFPMPAVRISPGTVWYGIYF